MPICLKTLLLQLRNTRVGESKPCPRQHSTSLQVTGHVRLRWRTAKERKEEGWFCVQALNLNRAGKRDLWGDRERTQPNSAEGARPWPKPGPFPTFPSPVFREHCSCLLCSLILHSCSPMCGGKKKKFIFFSSSNTVPQDPGTTWDLRLFSVKQATS